MTTPHHHSTEVPDDIGAKAAESLRNGGAAATLSGAISTYLVILPGSPLREKLLHILRELEPK